MTTKSWAIVVMIVCTMFTSAAQILYKIGADNLKYDLGSIMTNWPLIIGAILYIIGAILVIIALKGGEVTVLYPIITSSYIWVSLGSVYFFGEQMSFFKWIGTFLIVSGIMMISVTREIEVAAVGC